MVVVDSARGRVADGVCDEAETATVRYTGLVGAIDSYLEAVMSWDQSEAARRLGVANPRDGGSTISDDAGARLKSTSAAIGGSSEEQQQQQGRVSGDGVASPPQPQQQQQLPVRSAKKTILVGVDSPNSVARAARGWDNDAPVVAPGMRHYPQRNCNMAALVGNGGFSGRAAALEDGDEGNKVKNACWRG